MKPMLSVAATGVVAFLLWKALLVFLLPLVGVAVGFVVVVIKLVLMAAVICFAIWLARRWTRREAKVA